MPKERLAAFSDGVLAIIITIMVIEMKPPHNPTFEALAELGPVFLSYVLSFVYLAIYWNNHHHLLMTVDRVDGAMLWANMHLLFWLSLIPFATAWMGENGFAPLPTALYGAALLLPALAWVVLQAAIIRRHGREGTLGRALGGDWKGKVSPALYLVGIGAAFFAPAIAVALYAGVALIWLVPDRRIERTLGSS